MLESPSRLQTNSGFTSALRDLPSFVCSVQPNRSLPLRPAPPIPRRKPCNVLRPVQHHHNSTLANNENEKSACDKLDEHPYKNLNFEERKKTCTAEDRYDNIGKSKFAFRHLANHVLHNCRRVYFRVRCAEIGRESLSIFFTAFQIIKYTIIII